jgi:hypothetical protein
VCIALRSASCLPTRSFVKEFGTLRRKAEHSGSELEVQMLTNLLNTLKNLVSLLRERTHDALMSEVLGIKLWSTAPVRGVKCEQSRLGHFAFIS